MFTVTVGIILALFATSAITQPVAPSMSPPFLPDAYTLLEFYNGTVGFSLEDWRVDNINNMCRWKGVTCDANGRVETLRLEGLESPSTRIDALLALNASRFLDLISFVSVGRIPLDQFFQKPTLRDVIIRRNAWIAPFPTNASSTLGYFATSYPNISGTLPEVFPWNQLFALEIYYGQLECPLPESLLSRSTLPAAALTPWDCDLRFNHLWVRGGKICGQLPIRDFSCKIFPQLPGPSPPPPATPTVISHRKWLIEIDEYTLRFFKVENGTARRDHSISVSIPPVQKFRGNVENLELDPLTEINQVSNDEYQIAYLARSNSGEFLRGSIKLHLDPSLGNIKIDNQILSMNLILTGTNLTRIVSRNELYQLHFSFTFHTPILAAGELPPVCSLLPQILGPGICNTRIANISSTVDFTNQTDLSPNLIVCRVETAATRLGVSFTRGLETTGFDILRTFEHWGGIGAANFLNPMLRANLTQSINRPPAPNEQSLTLIAQYSWENYDLAQIPNSDFFSPENSTSLNATTSVTPIIEVQVLQPGNSGVIVGAVIGAILCFSAVVLLVIFLMRRRRRRAANRESAEPLNLISDLTYVQNLGQGSHGSVMLASYRGEFVAVKQLSQTDDSPGTEAALADEADVMATVKNNPNIVKLVKLIPAQQSAADSNAGSRAILMEFCPRGSLTNYMKEHSLTEYEVFKFAYGVANGMAGLATAQIVHRDLACRNILLSDHLHAKVSDFGLATRAAKVMLDSSNSHLSDSLGPIKWQAPEVLQSNSYSEQSDVWSYGCCMIEMITYHEPYHGFAGSLVDLISQISAGAISPLDHLIKTDPQADKIIPNWLASVLRSCFHISATSRPTFREIRYALAKAMRDWKNQVEDELDEIESVLSAPGTYNPVAVPSASRPKKQDTRMSTHNNVLFTNPSIANYNIELSHIERLSRLGSGSFGSVYLGQSKGTYVALKVLESSSSSQGADHREQIKREAFVMANIPPHRNIIQIFGVVESATDTTVPKHDQELQISIVMEFASRGSLESLLLSARSGDLVPQTPAQLTEAQMFRWALGIARGMANLTAANIVHRDLATRNILLDASLEPKVADFGLARTVLDASVDSYTKTDVGPLRWFAPECYAFKYSEKSDVWAYGCTMVEILTGNVPFASLKIMQVAAAVKDKNQTPLDYIQRDSLPVAPFWLFALTQKCFALSPQDRPSFAGIVSMLEVVGTEIPEIQRAEIEIQKRRNRRADSLRSKVKS